MWKEAKPSHSICRGQSILWVCVWGGQKCGTAKQTGSSPSSHLTGRGRVPDYVTPLRDTAGQGQRKGWSELILGTKSCGILIFNDVFLCGEKRKRTSFAVCKTSEIAMSLFFLIPGFSHHFLLTILESERMLMMMMMMRRKGSKESLAMLALLLASASSILPPSEKDLNGEFGKQKHSFSALFLKMPCCCTDSCSKNWTQKI